MNLEQGRKFSPGAGAEAFTPQQRAALVKAALYQRRIAKNGLGPLVADLFRQTNPENFLTYAQIAEVVIPGVAQKFPNIAETAIAGVIKEFVPDPVERREISGKRKAVILAANLEKTDPSILREAKIRAVATREQRIRDGVVTSNIHKLHKAMGHTEWTEAEIRDLENMAQSEEYRRPEGQNRAGHPDWNRISRTLNLFYHEGKAIRTPNKSSVRYQKTKPKTLA